MQGEGSCLETMASQSLEQKLQQLFLMWGYVLDSRVAVEVSFLFLSTHVFFVIVTLPDPRGPPDNPGRTSIATNSTHAYIFLFFFNPGVTDITMVKEEIGNVEVYFPLAD